jgi:cobalt-zinc-cadmium efflux system protein
MGHYHKQHHEPVISGRNLLIATILNFVITVAEVIGGILSNSLALLSDALHNFSDGIAVLIAFIANKVSKRPSDTRRTFGYKRIEILAAFFNAIILIVIIIYLFYESVLRLYEPEPIKGLIMMVVAIIGLLANLLAVLLLRKDSKVNLNVRSAYLHLLGDTLSSVAVIIGGVLIYFFETFWVDPLITILVGIYLIRETWTVLKETVDILMQSTPSSIDLGKVQLELEKLDSIKNIHHVHIWSLSDSMIHFECHVDLDKDLHVSRTEKLLRQMEEILHDKFDIHHTTIQVEYSAKDKKTIIN